MMNTSNTSTWSDLSKFDEHTEEVEEYCQEHAQRKVLFMGKGPFCPVCSAEKVKEEHKVEAIEMTERHENSPSDWLKDKSIYLDKTIRYANFDSYITDDNETKENKKKALEIVRDYYEGATYNTILQGKAGTGKSHLAMSTLKYINQYSKESKKCLFVSIDELMRRIKASFNDKESIYTEANMVRMLSQVDFLVLDDLGAETGSIHSEKVATDYTTQILYAVMNARQDKPTIFTTNLSNENLVKKYDTKLVSRMFKGAEGHFVKFEKTTDKRASYK